MEYLKQYEQDGITPIYFRAAQEHEVMFRGILCHIKAKSAYMPQDFDVDQPIRELLDACNPRPSHYRFDVYGFQVGPAPGTELDTAANRYGVEVRDTDALIAIGNFATMSGMGEILKYSNEAGAAPHLERAFMQTRG